jgi:hypothetical protein
MDLNTVFSEKAKAISPVTHAVNVTQQSHWLASKTTG